MYDKLIKKQIDIKHQIVLLASGFYSYIENLVITLDNLEEVRHVMNEVAPILSDDKLEHKSVLELMNKHSIDLKYYEHDSVVSFICNLELQNTQFEIDLYNLAIQEYSFYT